MTGNANFVRNCAAARGVLSRAVIAAVFASTLALGGCSSAGGGDASLLGAALPEPDSARARGGAAQSEYRISPSDTIEVNVYQVPNLSRTVQVDGAGRISLPLIGAVLVSGRTVNELEGDITRRYGARYLQSPQISVFLKESVGRQITVDGAVKKPGVYMLKGHTTLLQALALAEGINDVGDVSAVTLARTADGKRVSAHYDVGAIRSGGAADPLVYGGDTITVDESVARHGLQVLKAAVPTAIQVGTKVIP